MPVRSGHVELFFGPSGQPARPDDLQQVVIHFIDGASKSLHVAVQELDNRPIAEALIRAKQREVKVSVVLEEDYLRDDLLALAPFDAGGKWEPNRKILAALLRSSIPVKIDFNPGIFHQKFIVRDSNSLLTGSANFTDTDMTTNLNHLVVIHPDAGSRSPWKIVRNYDREFTEISKGKFGKESEVDFSSPEYEDAGGILVKALFAPDHGPEMEIMKNMLKASESIHFAIFTFSESSGIDDTLLVLANAGIRITGVFDGNQSSQEWAASKILQSPKLSPAGRRNIDFQQVFPQDRLRKLHHKLMVIDSQVVIAGSFNYTSDANYINDENILVIGDRDSADPALIESQKTLGTAAVQEITEIAQRFGRPMA